MTFPEDIKNIINNSKITDYKKSVEGFDIIATINSKDPELVHRAEAFIGFYDDYQTSIGISKEMAAKAVLKMNELFVRKSIEREIMAYLEQYKGTFEKAEGIMQQKPQVQPLMSAKEKSAFDFRCYLQYAAEKYGDAKDLAAMQRLIKKVK